MCMAANDSRACSKGAHPNGIRYAIPMIYVPISRTSCDRPFIESVYL